MTGHRLAARRMRSQLACRRRIAFANIRLSLWVPRL